MPVVVFELRAVSRDDVLVALLITGRENNFPEVLSVENGRGASIARPESRKRERQLDCDSKLNGRVFEALLHAYLAKTRRMDIGVFTICNGDHGDGYTASAQRSYETAGV